MRAKRANQQKGGDNSGAGSDKENGVDGEDRQQSGNVLGDEGDEDVIF